MSRTIKKQGRPEGSLNREYLTATAIQSTCPACGSTDRSEYSARTDHEFNGIDPFGNSYNLVVWRSCQCKACGQWRRDRSFEMKKESVEPNI